MVSLLIHKAEYFLLSGGLPAGKAVWQSETLRNDRRQINRNNIIYSKNSYINIYIHNFPTPFKKAQPLKTRRWVGNRRIY